MKRPKVEEPKLPFFKTNIMADLGDLDADDYDFEIVEQGVPATVGQAIPIKLMVVTEGPEKGNIYNGLLWFVYEPEVYA